MEYGYRNRAGAQSSMYGPPATTAPPPPPSSSATHHPMYGPPQPSFYPKVGLHQPGFMGRTVPPFHPSPSPSSSSTGIGIRVAIKPQYRITPPPQLSPQTGDISRSSFHFDFDLERKIVAEAEKVTQNWSKLGLENMPSSTLESTSSLGATLDPVVSKYIASGLNREAVPLAVANYGDNPTKVKEFVNGYTLLREMGFSSNNVAEALLMHDNDTDKALAHFLNSSA